MPIPKNQSYPGIPKELRTYLNKLEQAVQDQQVLISTQAQTISSVERELKAAINKLALRTK